MHRVVEGSSALRFSKAYLACFTLSATDWSRFEGRTTGRLQAVSTPPEQKSNAQATMKNPAFEFSTHPHTPPRSNSSVKHSARMDGPCQKFLTRHNTTQPATTDERHLNLPRGVGSYGLCYFLRTTGPAAPDRPRSRLSLRTRGPGTSKLARYPLEPKPSGVKEGALSPIKMNPSDLQAFSEVSISSFHLDECFAVAEYEYRAEYDSSHALSFQKTQMIRPTSRKDDGWWFCEIDGVLGWVPSNYCRSATYLEISEYGQCHLSCLDSLESELRKTAPPEHSLPAPPGSRDDSEVDSGCSEIPVRLQDASL